MKTHRKTKTLVLVLVCVTVVVISCARKSTNSAEASLPAVLTDNTESPVEKAHYVYANYKCEGCHTLNNEGKFGYTARGEELRKTEEGCVGLLTSMGVIAHIPESSRNETQKTKAGHFTEFGCSVCHKVEPGKMSLTPTGERLTTLHMSCPEVEKLLTTKVLAKSSD
ncbi:MAG: hypothetical protein ACREA9_11820 [Pyrinomonadaceae bacterium]